jgi:hypothetical protein
MLAGFPWPNWPESPQPQVYTMPVVRAMPPEKDSPPATKLNGVVFVVILMSTGDSSLFSLFPVPSWPLVLCISFVVGVGVGEVEVEYYFTHYNRNKPIPRQHSPDPTQKLRHVLSATENGSRRTL